MVFLDQIIGSARQVKIFVIIDKAGKTVFDKLLQQRFADGFCLSGLCAAIYEKSIERITEGDTSATVSKQFKTVLRIFLLLLVKRRKQDNQGDNQAKYDYCRNQIHHHKL